MPCRDNRWLPYRTGWLELIVAQIASFVCGDKHNINALLYAMTLEEMVLYSANYTTFPRYNIMETLAWRFFLLPLQSKGMQSSVSECQNEYSL